jgi:hypothetical protein
MSSFGDQGVGQLGIAADLAWFRTGHPDQAAVTDAAAVQ